MKGSLLKRRSADQLPCHSCIYFRDDDPDFFLCDLGCVEFPALCAYFRVTHADESGVADSGVDSG